MKKPTEDDLVQAALAIGQAAAACPMEEKEQIKKLYEQVQAFAESQKAKGVIMDRSAFFAAGLYFHPAITSQAVRDAAVAYIDLDLLFVRELEAAAL